MNDFPRETNLKMYIIIFLDGYPYIQGYGYPAFIENKKIFAQCSIVYTYVHVEYFEYYVTLILSLRRSIS